MLGPPTCVRQFPIWMVMCLSWTWSVGKPCYRTRPFRADGLASLRITLSTSQFSPEKAISGHHSTGRALRSRGQCARHRHASLFPDSSHSSPQGQQRETIQDAQLSIRNFPTESHMGPASCVLRYRTFLVVCVSWTRGAHSKR
jgi:hypothetical protein